MAWTVDQLSLGTATPVTGTSGLLTTSAAAASGAWVFVGAGNFGAGDLMTSVTGGGLDWAVASTGAQVGVISGLACAYAPTGLASSTAITVNFAGSTSEIKLAGASFLGGSATTAIEDADSNQAASGTAWTCPANALTNTALVVGGATLNLNSSSTPDGSTNEMADFQFSGSSTFTLVYRIVSGTGSNPIGGTWGSSTAWSAATAVFDLGVPADNTMRGASAGMFAAEFTGRGWF